MSDFFMSRSAIISECGLPAAVRFLSCEPLLGPVNFKDVAIGQRINGVRVDALTGCEWDDLGGRVDAEGLDWVIAGGESGSGARAMHPDWARSIRNQCAAASVPFFFKQWGEWTPLPVDASHPIWGERIAGVLMAWPDGTVGSDPNRCGVPIYRVGKKIAGRLLDGVEHNGMPA